MDRYRENVSKPQMQLTIKYEAGDDGWVVASIPQIPGAISQGRDREEAKAMVLDALSTLLSADGDTNPDQSEELRFELIA
jgi:predicted RNase H-like HicB family nuclease